MTNTDDLFQPRTLDVPGSELSEVVASIEARGGMIQRLDVVSVSGYRISIVWPRKAAGNDGLTIDPSQK